MPERNFIIINMASFKPAPAFWFCKTVEEAEAVSIQDLIGSVQRNIKRNMQLTCAEKKEGSQGLFASESGTYTELRFLHLSYGTIKFQTGYRYGAR